MRNSIVLLMLFAIAMCITTSCKEEKKVEPIPTPTPPAKQEVYQPKHQSNTVDLSSNQKYVYINAPTSQKATSVVVNYNPKVAYKEPIEIKYAYSNGDTYTYTIPTEFGLWENEAGFFRVVSDNECTVWLQGQTKGGKFKEFIFYGDPKNNGKKIKPNSYLNHPAGLIKYCK